MLSSHNWICTVARENWPSAPYAHSWVFHSISIVYSYYHMNTLRPFAPSVLTHFVSSQYSSLLLSVKSCTWFGQQVFSNHDISKVCHNIMQIAKTAALLLLSAKPATSSSSRTSKFPSIIGKYLPTLTYRGPIKKKKAIGLANTVIY